MALGLEQPHIEMPIPFDCRRLKSLSSRVIMQRIKNGRLATQVLTAVLLFSIAFATSAAQVIRRRIPPPPTGVARLAPAAACATDNTPRIGNINGTQSFVVLLQPGSQLNIAGCGFGNGGQAYLSVGIGVAVPLIVDTWNDSNIMAHIDSAIGGVRDIGPLNVHVKPNGAPELASASASGGSSSFRAARETALWALPASLGKYSQVYGTPKVTLSPDGKSTLVERNSTYSPFCPPVTNQEAQMQDIWRLDGGSFEQGFEVDSVGYQNMTDQLEQNNLVEEIILVGKNGGAYRLASTKSIIVTFQGHSVYTKKSGPVGEGVSACTSRYSVSLKLTGPRGVSPFK